MLLQFVLLRPLQAALVVPEVPGLSLLNAVFCTFAPLLMVMVMMMVMMMMMAIERIGVTLTAQTGMIGPLSTIALGVIILGEPFNGWIVVGTAPVLLGIGLLARASSMSSKG